jgi:NAD(P)-dependent dehydrogenase (short-subunit alcohol dehydrogenase family)
MTQPFADKSALVTGAGSGMGAATAILLAERGAAVTLVGRRRTKLDEVADEIRRAGGRPLVHEGDVSDPEDVRRAVEHTVAEFGGLDLAVNNAAIAGSTGTRIADIGIEEFQRTVAIDFASIFYGMKYEIAAMLQSGRGGAIVNVSSVFADRGLHGDYSGSKHGIRGLTRSAAKDYGEQGIRVVELQPGVIDTEMTAADPEGTAAVAATGIPLRRTGSGREIATVVAFLLSDDGGPCPGRGAMWQTRDLLLYPPTCSFTGSWLCYWR